MIKEKTMFKGFLMMVALVSFSAFGQSNVNGEWQVIKSQDGINFLGKTIECESTIQGQLPSSYAVLKIENTTASAKKVYYSFGLEFVEGCSGCDQDSEFSYVLELNPNQTIEGSCSNEDAHVYRIIKNYNLAGGWEYQSIAITNLIIE